MQEVKESKELTFGLYDGALVTLGLLSGLTGAGIATATLGLVGAVSVASGGLALGVVSYTAAQSHRAYTQAVYELERAEIEEHPAREKERVKEALAKKGLRGQSLREATDEITEEKDHWAHFFVEQRFGTAPEKPMSSWLVGGITGLSYAIAGLVTLAPFFVLAQPFAIILSALIALGVTVYAGVKKTVFTHRNPMLAGIESATTTAIVVAVSFVVGSLLQVFI